MVNTPDNHTMSTLNVPRDKRPLNDTHNDVTVTGDDKNTALTSIERSNVPPINLHLPQQQSGNQRESSHKNYIASGRSS